MSLRTDTEDVWEKDVENIWTQEEVRGGLQKFHTKELHSLCSSPNNRSWDSSASIGMGYRLDKACREGGGRGKEIYTKFLWKNLKTT